MRIKIPEAAISELNVLVNRQNVVEKNIEIFCKGLAHGLGIKGSYQVDLTTFEIIQEEECKQPISKT